MLLQDKVIVVMGATGLIGRALSDAIVSAGGTLVVADIDKKSVDDYVRDYESLEDRVVPVCVDITNKSHIDGLIEKIDKEKGRIDAVVNASYPRGRAFGTPLEEVEFKNFNENINCHLGGYFLLMQRFALYFKTQGHGNIVNISSIYGSMIPRFGIYEGTDMTMPIEYAAIKSALEHITRYFAKYYAKDGIRCNTLSPGGILDGQPEKFLESYNSYCGKTGMLQPSDLVGSLLFLLSEHSSHVTGQNLIVDDGFTL